MESSLLPALHYTSSRPPDVFLRRVHNKFVQLSQRKHFKKLLRGSSRHRYVQDCPALAPFSYPAPFACAALPTCRSILRRTLDTIRCLLGSSTLRLLLIWRCMRSYSDFHVPNARIICYIGAQTVAAYGQYSLPATLKRCLNPPVRSADANVDFADILKLAAPSVK